MLAAPLSHCSPGSIVPLPHLSLQSASHLSAELPLLMPSSHCSGPLMTPSPQCGAELAGRGAVAVAAAVERALVALFAVGRHAVAAVRRPFAAGPAHLGRAAVGREVGCRRRRSRGAVDGGIAAVGRARHAARHAAAVGAVVLAVVADLVAEHDAVAADGRQGLTACVKPLSVRRVVRSRSCGARAWNRAISYMPPVDERRGCVGPGRVERDAYRLDAPWMPPRSTASLPLMNTQTSSSPVKSSVSPPVVR